jgi:hypothetical protein
MPAAQRPAMGFDRLRLLQPLITRDHIERDGCQFANVSRRKRHGEALTLTTEALAAMVKEV